MPTSDGNEWINITSGDDKTTIPLVAELAVGNFFIFFFNPNRLTNGRHRARVC